MLNIKDKHVRIITNKDKIMDCWREYFEELTYTDTQNQDEEGEEVNEDREIKSIGKEDLEEAIKMLKLGKAPDKDNITPEMIKHVAKAG